MRSILLEVWQVDEGFQNVLIAICSAKLWILWCLNKLCAVQSVMISFTGGQFSVLWRWIL